MAEHQLALELGDDYVAPEKSMHPIIKNVPVPKGTRTEYGSRSKYPFTLMEVGDMFFVPHKAKNTMSTIASTLGRKLGRRFSTRRTYMKVQDGMWTPCDMTAKGAVQGIGVWRTA